jgi:hypothetical protein
MDEPLVPHSEMCTLLDSVALVLHEVEMSHRHRVSTDCANKLRSRQTSYHGTTLTICQNSNCIYSYTDRRWLYWVCD